MTGAMPRWTSVRRRLALRLPGLSQLDVIIPPEIVNDGFSRLISQVAAEPSVSTAVEIGSSNGAGSTQALVAGLQAKPYKRLYCLEVSAPRFADLCAMYSGQPWVIPINTTSVGLTDFPTAANVADFYRRHPDSPMRRTSLRTVLRWLEQDVKYVSNLKEQRCGIDLIKDDLRDGTIDLVLIDGSEFTGSAELQHLYGTAYVLLDDIRTFKNSLNYARLKDDRNYELIAEDPAYRNGYAAFRLRIPRR